MGRAPPVILERYRRKRRAKNLALMPSYTRIGFFGLRPQNDNRKWSRPKGP